MNFPLSFFADQADQLKAKFKREISQLAEERNKCRVEQKRWEKAGVPAYVDLWRASAKEKTDKMRELYQDIRMCDEIITSSPTVRLNAFRLIQQRAYEEQKRKLRLEMEKAKKQRVRVR